MNLLWLVDAMLWRRRRSTKLNSIRSKHGLTGFTVKPVGFPHRAVSVEVSLIKQVSIPDFMWDLLHEVCHLAE